MAWVKNVSQFAHTEATDFSHFCNIQTCPQAHSASYSVSTGSSSGIRVTSHVYLVVTFWMHGPLLHMPLRHAQGQLKTLSLPLLPFKDKQWQRLIKNKYLIICIIKEIIQQSTCLLLDFFYIKYRHRHHRVLGARQNSTIANIIGTSGYWGWVRGGGKGS